MKKYTQLSVFLFLEFLAIGCNATCIYDTTQAYCVFLDIEATQCNACSPDTDYIKNIVPNSVSIDSYIGSCGCVLIIHESCIELVINAEDLHALALIKPTCLRKGQDDATSIITGTDCNGCSINSTTTQTPSPSVSLTPPPTAQTPPTSVSLTPPPTAQTSSPVPLTPPSTAVNASPTSSNPTPVSSNGCIAAHQTVLTHDNHVKMIKNLVLGDKVLTENGFQDYIGNIHSGDVYPTKIIYTKNGNNIELTYDHFIKTENGFVHAHKIIVGDVIITKYGKSKAIETKNSTSYVMSPFTRSGTIIVNNVVLSCYATDRSHYLANIAFLPVRAGIINNVEKYFKTLLYIFDNLPMWISTKIAHKST